MNAETAANLSRDALIWLAGQPDALGQFLAASGAAADDLRAGLRNPEFLGFVLDFILGSEEMVRDFTTGAGLPADTLLRARALLPGGALPNWT